MDERSLVELAAGWVCKDNDISIMSVGVCVTTKRNESQFFTITNLHTRFDPWVVEWKFQKEQGFYIANTVAEVMDFFKDVRKAKCELYINEDNDIIRKWKLTTGEQNEN